MHGFLHCSCSTNQKDTKALCGFFQAPGSPLFCKNSDGAYGLAGIYFGQKHDKRVAFFAITGKWREDFIYKVIQAKNGDYRILWENSQNPRRKGSGSPRMKTPSTFCLVWILLKLII